MYEIFEGANGYYVAYVDSDGRRRWNEGDDRSHHGWDREAAEQELLRYRMFSGATGVYVPAAM